MTEFLQAYGLFLTKTVTIVVAIAIVLVLIARMRKTKGLGQTGEQLEVVNLNDQYDRMGQTLKKAILPKRDFARLLKAERGRRKKQRKTERATAEQRRKKLFVVDFHGDIKATAAASLREVITTILMEATAEDEVLVRLENAGGMVHEHGLAASQLARLRRGGIPLTVSVDKIAASGGYLMACVADRIIAAPFAVLGSIGVLAQIPNFHRLLNRHGIEFEQLKAGQYKRTITMFGKNTREDREKVQEQLEDVHALFKSFIQHYRPAVDLKQVATGEYWHAAQALDRKLVDELVTSDDYLLAAREHADIYLVSYSAKKTVVERVVSSIDQAVTRWAWHG